MTDRTYVLCRVDRLSSFIYSSNEIHTFDDMMMMMMIFNDSTVHTHIFKHSYMHARTLTNTAQSKTQHEDRKSLRLYQYLQHVTEKVNEWANPIISL